MNKHLTFYCPVIDYMAGGNPDGAFEGYADGYDPEHVFGPIGLAWHVLWCNKFKPLTTIKDLMKTRRVTKESIVATAARKFVADNYYDYMECKESASLSIEPSFMNLCHYTIAVYGPPKDSK